MTSTDLVLGLGFGLIIFSFFLGTLEMDDKAYLRIKAKLVTAISASFAFGLLLSIIGMNMVLR